MIQDVNVHVCCSKEMALIMKTTFFTLSRQELTDSKNRNVLEPVNVCSG
jgi:hypothetical protein